MRSPLSRFQTPATPRRVSRFFRVWLPGGLPRRTDHPAYFGLAKSDLTNPFSRRQKKSKFCTEKCQRRFFVHHYSPAVSNGLVRNSLSRCSLGMLEEKSPNVLHRILHNGQPFCIRP